MNGYLKLCEGYEGPFRRLSPEGTELYAAFVRGWQSADQEIQRLRALASFRALPWYRRAWLTLTGKAPR